MDAAMKAQCERLGNEVLRLRAEVGRLDEEHEAGVANPTLPNTAAGRAPRDLALSRAREALVTAEEQFRVSGCTEADLERLQEE